MGFMLLVIAPNPEAQQELMTVVLALSRWQSLVWVHLLWIVRMSVQKELAGCCLPVA